MKQFFLIISLLVAYQCQAQTKPASKTCSKREQDENIRIQSAIVEPFSASSGKITGSMYRMRIMILTDDEITLDSMWVEDVLVSTSMERYTMHDAHKKTKLKQNETVSMAGNIKDQSRKIMEKCPHKYEGAALIRYTIKGEPKYFAVQNIKKQSGDRDNFKK